MKLLAEVIEQGAKPPYFYALSYYCFDSTQAIYYPWGINLLVRWGRSIYFWIFMKLSYSKYQQKILQSRASLLRQYWIAGFEAGKQRKQIPDEILTEFDKKKGG